MTTNTTTEQFGHLLRTVDPAGLGTEDTLARISLLGRVLAIREGRADDEIEGAAR